MTVLIDTNFQGSTSVPSTLTIPGGGASIVTNTSPQLYGPNSLSIPNNYAFLATTDSSNGDMTVTCSIMFGGSFPPPGTSAGIYGGPIITIGAQSGWSSGNGFFFFIFNNSGINQLVIGVTHNGSTGTSWGNISSGNPAFSSGVWYTMTLVRNHSYLIGVIKREDTGQWMSSAGAWQFDYVEAITFTDTNSMPFGVSYPGVIAFNPLPTYIGRIYARDQVTRLPAGKLKGATITNNYLGPYDSTTNWVFANPTVLRVANQSGVLDQLDLIKSLGCNIVRFDHPMFGYWYGTYTRDQVISMLSQSVAYARKLGLWVIISTYPQYGPYYPVSDPTQWQDLSGQIVNDLTAMATVLASYPNTFGFDLWNEHEITGTINMYSGQASQGNFVTTTAQQASCIAMAVLAIRAVAPNLALTVSKSSISAPAFAYLLDYIDFHSYTDQLSPPTGLNNASGAYGKYIWNGEMGWHTSDAVTSTQITDMWNNVVNGSYPGQPGCLGMVFWSLEPQQAPQPGLFSGNSPEVLNATYGPTFKNITVPSYFFGGGGRRRRPR